MVCSTMPNRTCVERKTGVPVGYGYLNRYYLRQLHHQRYTKTVPMYFSIDLTAHERHQPFADEQPQTVALYLVSIISPMKTPEYLRKFLRFKSTACIRHRYQLTAVHFIETNLDSLAVTVFDRIFDQVLQAFAKAICITGKNAVIISVYDKFRSRNAELRCISRIDLHDDLTQEHLALCDFKAHEILTCGFGDLADKLLDLVRARIDALRGTAAFLFIGVYYPCKRLCIHLSRRERRFDVMRK